MVYLHMYEYGPTYEGGCWFITEQFKLLGQISNLINLIIGSTLMSTLQQICSLKIHKPWKYNDIYAYQYSQIYDVVALVSQVLYYLHSIIIMK